MFSRRKQGFTLPEVLVTVAIVAVLAAVVVPAVTQQIGKGDSSKLQSDIDGLRSSITAFVSDVRKYPGRVSHLYSAINGTDTDISAAQYGAAAAGRWKGPYQVTGIASGDSVNSALAYIRDALKDSNLVSGTSGQMIVTLSGVYTPAAAAKIDSILDNATGQAAGALKWRAPAGGAIPDSSVKLVLMSSR